MNDLTTVINTATENNLLIPRIVGVTMLGVVGYVFYRVYRVVSSHDSRNIQHKDVENPHLKDTTSAPKYDFLKN